MEKQNLNYILLADEDKLKTNLEKDSEKGKTITDTRKAVKGDKNEEK